MNYIVFDLEWNQCPYGKNREVKTLPFEIIEIGAIKLNKDREYVDRFHKIIKPVVYPKLHFRTKEIVHLDQDALEKGALLWALRPMIPALHWLPAGTLYLYREKSPAESALEAEQKPMIARLQHMWPLFLRS